MQSIETDIQILGGGPAGLATGYYAKKRGLDFVLFESGSEVGGNCRTIRVGDFLFDTGAHRFHDKDSNVTSEVKKLLGSDLFHVDAPSEIFFEGQFYQFPLSLSDLAEKLDAKTLFRIAWDKLHVERGRPADDFATFAINRYGRTLAESFLLNYSEKLWGEPPSKLSVAVSGGRLRGLNLKNLIRSALLGDSAAQNHLDGSFLYPKYGIGMIADKLSESIGYERIRTKSRVSRLVHKSGKIERVMLNDGETEMPATTVINTLPLTLTLKILDPPPPPELIDTAVAIKYRHLMLSVFCLNRNSFSPNASLYFPSEEFPFTRLYEPKNRSPYMAPEGQTAIVLELPCYTEDAIWNMSDEALRSEVWDAVCRVKPIRREDVIHFLTYRLPFAYPVLTVGFEENVSSLIDYLATFGNMHLTGRSALHRYLHLHDLLRSGQTLVEQIAGLRAPDTAAFHNRRG